MENHQQLMEQNLKLKHLLPVKLNLHKEELLDNQLEALLEDQLQEQLQINFNKIILKHQNQLKKLI